MAENQEDTDTSKLEKLQKIAEEIVTSWQRDCDRTEYMTELTDMLKEMLTKETIEEYFSNNEETFNYFMGKFFDDVIGNILTQPKVYGDNGDEIALNLLFHIYKLFLKFHKNLKYSPLFSKIRNIFHRESGSTSYFTDHKYIDDDNNYDYRKFNSKNCAAFEKNREKFNIGDEVDFMVENRISRNFMDKKAWVRGTIKNIEDDKYSIEYAGGEEIQIPIEDYNLCKKGTKTKDWDWRKSLKKYDVVDCFDRGKWYPTTVERVNSDGTYRIAFRLYPKHFKNPEDENDTYDKHLDIWKQSRSELEENTNEEDEKYYGDGDNCSEEICFYSKRIQKFNTYSACQQRNINYTYSNYNNSEEANDMKLMNDQLYYDSSISIDDFYYYELNGKKNYILGKDQDFSYYFALLLKKMEEDNDFVKFIEILKDQPNTEEIYNIFFILTYCFPYLHKDYFEENKIIIHDSVINYINNLKDKEMRNLPKDLIEIVTNLLYKVEETKEALSNEKGGKEELNLHDEITLALSLKTIKTSFFDRRLNGIKTLNEFIEKNKNNKGILTKIIDLIKKNEIISEIFGANYHSQLISKSNEIVKLLLIENELSEDDIKLIWNCTKKGDLEAKLTILKLLSELAPYLKENIIEMILNNIRSNVDIKYNEQEIELVYKLSTEAKGNEKNIELCCDYLCQCLLISSDSNIKNSPILVKLLEIIEKDKKYLKKVFNFCEKAIKNNKKPLMSYSILFEVMDKFSKEKNEINDFIKDKHLLNLFEDNFRLYIRLAQEILTKNNINFSEGDAIDKYMINEFTHLDNIKKRIEVYCVLIKKYYTDYNFIPFLKEVLLINPVCPNDLLIFYDFIKKYFSDDNNKNLQDSIRKEKLREEIFELLSEKNQTEITIEQIKLFKALFFYMNKDKIKTKENNKYDPNSKEDDIEIVKVDDFDNLIGLDKLWNIIFQIKKEKVLSIVINIIFQLYNNENIEKLLDKCSDLITEDDSTPEVIEKCIILLKLIIVESEKNCLFKPKSHLSLLKNCLIHLPLEIKEKKNENNNDIQKYLLLGNTTFNDLKLLIAKTYSIPMNLISFTFTEKYLKFLKTNNLIEKDDIDESNNNNTLFELLIEKDSNNSSKLKPNEKIVFHSKPKEKTKLIIDGEVNPKLIDIFKDWFRDFTEGSMKMDRPAIVRFIKGVTKAKSISNENDSRVNNFLKNDKDNKGYVSEEEFINFYKEALNKKEQTVWDNLKEMGVNEDLRRKGEAYEFNYIDNDQLPRYKLGNDSSFIENLLEKYYKNPNLNSSFIDFLLYLSTNEKIYDYILENLFDNYNDDNSFVSKGLDENDENNYAEQNYIFIIIESILYDLEVSLYYKYMETHDFIMFDNNQYKLLSEKYEPFDDEDKIEDKLTFVKNLVKSENLQKILSIINKILERIIKLRNDNANENILPKLYDCCLRGIKIINTIINFTCDNKQENKFNTNCLKKLKEKNVYKLGFCNISSLFEDFDFKEEMEGISYLDLSNNLLNYLNNSQKKEKEEKEKNKINDNKLQKECLNLFINLLSSNKQLLEEYTTNDEEKKELIFNIFQNYFSEKEQYKKDYFLQNLTQSIDKAKNSENNDYIQFLLQSVNSFLDHIINSQIQEDENAQKENNRSVIDNTFFDLCNNLYKLISENKDNAMSNENSFIFKIYNLIVKCINNLEQGKKIDTKFFASLLQLLKTLMKGNEELQNEILFKEVDGNSLFNFLLKKTTKEIEENSKKEESLQNSDNEKAEDQKFICLESAKEDGNDNESEKELLEISNDFLSHCFQGTKNPKLISELLKLIILLKKTLNKNGKDVDKDDDDDNNNNTTSSSSNSTRSCDHVGLKNLGCICYMNSIIQQMYMVPTFRYAIMSADDGETEKPSSGYNYAVDDDNLLHQLQKMYTYLTYSNKMDYNPRDFCYSYKDFEGKPTNVRAQQDSQEFYNNFCDKIENSLKKTKFKYIVSDVFYGNTYNSISCDQCKYVSYRFEDFYNLTLEVKNITNLKDSLQKLNVPEIIDDFKCSSCGQKVRITKVTSLNKLPNVLVVHLKSFYLNYETFKTKKIDSKFEFTKDLNLKEFCVDEINKNMTNNEKENENLVIYNKEDDYYEYELRGINVHTGSASGGHYFSFIDVNREGKNNLMNKYTKENWLQFNDSRVSTFNTETIPKECFGGISEGSSVENRQNGYLLIYERKKKTPIRVLIEEKNIDKEKEKDNIIKINKDNKDKINKEYDLSRISNDKKEEDLFNKIFFDEEKNEYYKYIPYYNIPKYAPRKVYNEIMKENNINPTTESPGQKNKKQYNNYTHILLAILKDTAEFDINNDNYDDTAKETIIKAVLNDFFKAIRMAELSNDEEKNEVNTVFSFIINKLMKPIIKEDMNKELLQFIYMILIKEDNAKYIF